MVAQKYRAWLESSLWTEGWQNDRSSIISSFSDVFFKTTNLYWRTQDYLLNTALTAFLLEQPIQGFCLCWQPLQPIRLTFITTLVCGNHFISVFSLTFNHSKQIRSHPALCLSPSYLSFWFSPDVTHVWYRTETVTGKQRLLLCFALPSLSLLFSLK